LAKVQTQQSDKIMQLSFDKVKVLQSELANLLCNTWTLSKDSCTILPDCWFCTLAAFLATS
jgi:hypothetical protein